MQLPLAKGGFNFPNLPLYQKAVLIHQSTEWMRSDQTSDHPWVILETGCVTPRQPMVMLFAKTKLKTKQALKSINTARGAWAVLSKTLDENFYASRDAPIWGNPKLKHLNNKVKVQRWVDKGITTLGDIFENDRIVEFNALVDKYGLDDSFKKDYHHLMSVIMVSDISNVYSHTSKSEELSKIIKVAAKCDLKMNWLYKALKSQFEISLDPQRIKWSMWLNEDIDEKKWSLILKNISRSTHDLNLKWMQQRIVMDLYWYPLKMYSQNIIESDLCWNCKKAQGSFIHMMWNCSRLNVFWDEVYTRMNLITSSVVPKEASTAILGDSTCLRGLNKGKQEWILTALTCARRNILKCWKASPPPSVEVWLNDLSEMAAMEKILAKRLKCMEKFEEKWYDFMEVYAT